MKEWWRSARLGVSVGGRLQKVWVDLRLCFDGLAVEQSRGE